jgi:Ca2+-transporting ATPase
VRAADIGIAMGSGTDVALSVADIALTHDRLDTVLDAVRQGRTIEANTRKALHFLISSNLSEIVMVFGSVLFGRGEHSLTPLQLLWLNLLTDLLPAIALAAEGAEADVMDHPARDASAPVLGRDELWRYARESGMLAGGALGASLWSGLRGGGASGTVGFDALVLGQMLHAFYCRSDRHHTFFDPANRPNGKLSMAIVLSLLVQLGAHWVPGLRRLLGLSPLAWSDLLAIAAGAGLPLLANEAFKPTAHSSAATRASAERSTIFSTNTAATTLATPVPALPLEPAPPARA